MAVGRFRGAEAVPSDDRASGGLGIGRIGFAVAGPVLTTWPGDFSDELSVGRQIAHKPDTVGAGPPR